jgi:hypothetical protein
MPVYASMIGKNGVKLTAGADPSTHGGLAAPGAWNLKIITAGTWPRSFHDSYRGP